MKKLLLFILFCLAAYSLFAGGSRDTPRPSWVNQPYSVYLNHQYLAFTGSGSNREAAENNARAALARYFRQSISNQIVIIESEHQVNNQTNSSFYINQVTETSVEFDSLSGVEIGDVWHDRNGWWAVAIMEKARGRQLYNAELNRAIIEINRLSDISASVSFEALSRCRTAKQRLSEAGLYAIIINLLDGPNRLEELNPLAARVDNAIRTIMSIPIYISLTGVQDHRIRTAFNRAYTEQGFLFSGTASRFILEINIRLEHDTRGQTVSTTCFVNAFLRDTVNNTRFFPYDLTMPRETHLDIADADRRALLRAAERIESELSGILAGQLNP